MGFFSSNETTTSRGWSQTTFAPMDPLLSELLGYSTGAARAISSELGALPSSLSLAALADNPIVRMFGSVDKFREFMQNPSLSPEQKANLERAFMAPYEALEARQGAAATSARERLKLGAEEVMAGFREGRGASGIRGTTAGSAGLARALAGLGQGQVEFERGLAAERAATGAEAAGGLAGALLEMPFRNQQSMLAGLGAMMQERGQRIQVRGLSEDMRRALMSNPAIAQLFTERLAGGRTETFQQQTSPKEGWGSQLLGLGTRAALAYLTGGTSEAAGALAPGATYNWY